MRKTPEPSTASHFDAMSSEQDGEMSDSSEEGGIRIPIRKPPHRA